MIGVAAPAGELETATEFFELFKSPWEPVRASKRYRVVLCTLPQFDGIDAEVILLYGSRVTPFDQQASMASDLAPGPTTIERGSQAIYVFGDARWFRHEKDSTPAERASRIGYHRHCSGRVIRRIGYDLFQEVRVLLSGGQPRDHALAPTLELHIALLREVLYELNVSFVEVLPRPAQADFICCLTHDIDFFGIRRHKADRTLAGFAARASVGSLSDWLSGRRTFGEAVRNWRTLFTLPLVFAGMLPDPWTPFDDYASADRGRPSTFFVVPFKRRPGLSPTGECDASRAVAYDVSDARREVRDTVARANEVAVHGIDAWRDADAGRAEMDRVAAVSEQPAAGIRMHWLYFSEQSPQQLERAGYEYDSTCGFNDAVGYRAGTSQVFRMPATSGLMELPLTIMDTALFYRGRMALQRREAFALCRQIVANARTFGGTVVINWHDRSLAPERLWGSFYSALVDEIETARPWFATAGQTVAWFKWRRSIGFSTAEAGRAAHVVAPRAFSPGSVVRVHRPDRADRATQDHPFDGSESLRVDL